MAGVNIYICFVFCVNVISYIANLILTPESYVGWVKLHYTWSLTNNLGVRTHQKFNGGNVRKINSKIST